VVFFDKAGRLDAPRTYAAIKTRCAPGRRVVIPGFYGTAANGEVKTFSRGGSDVSGSIVANAIDAALYENWTDVSGFLMTDPRIVPEAKGIAEIITVAGYVNVDFEDVNTVMRGSGVAIMGTAAVEGEGRARRAVDEALNSPLLEDNNIHGAQNMLVNITSGIREATMDEIFEVTEFVQREAGENANLIWGNCYDERLGEKLSVTIIATGFEASRKTAPLQAHAWQPGCMRWTTLPLCRTWTSSPVRLGPTCATSCCPRWRAWRTCSRLKRPCNARQACVCRSMF
jgi:hypothetical protein